MNIHRAMQISQSGDMKYVTYNNELIYIQHVDEHTNMVRIFSLENPENEYDVRISDLKESTDDQDLSMYNGFH